jgi:polar amino acid transport system substrate-binding protein
MANVAVGTRTPGPAGPGTSTRVRAAPAVAGRFRMNLSTTPGRLRLLQQGQVVAISTDDTILDGFVAQDPFTKVVGPALTKEPYGLAIARQHPDLGRLVNAVLAAERADGAWATSYARWVGTSVPAPPSAQYAR